MGRRALLLSLHLGLGLGLGIVLAVSAGTAAVGTGLGTSSHSLPTDPTALDYYDRLRYAIPPSSISRSDVIEVDVGKLLATSSPSATTAGGDFPTTVQRRGREKRHARCPARSLLVAALIRDRNLMWYFWSSWEQSTYQRPLQHLCWHTKHAR